MVISIEYKKFLEEVRPKFSTYESVCRISERVLPIKPTKDLEKRYDEAIEFAHLRITARGAFSFSFLASLLFSFFSLLLSFSLGVLSDSVVVLIVVFDLLIFYYLYNYPFHLATMFRINASSEMVLAVIYMSIAMRVNPNLENAVKFAASNLTGLLGYDFKKIIWDLYTGKYLSISEALGDFCKRWKRENEEFVEAIDLIETSLTESAALREKSLDEAVSVMINGTRERMKHYAHELRSPVTVINTMGIVLPIIGLVFFPIIAIFMPDLVKPVFLGIGYNIILPITVFWMMKNSLERRPYSFHQPDISKHPEFAHEKTFNKITLISALIPILPVSFSAYMISTSGQIFSFNNLIYSLLILCSGIFAIVFYCVLSVIKKLRLREEVSTIESEFPEALFQLGTYLSRGVPVEKSLREVTAKIRDLRISRFFAKILYNIETFGMTLEQAIFDKEYGAINFYPSRMIEAVMKAITSISRRGMAVVSKAMISISSYLKDVKSVEEELKDVLSESTSDMRVQALLLAPLTSAIVVSMTAAMMRLMVSFAESVEKIQKLLLGSGPAGMTGNVLFSSLININKMIPVHWFQMIVGIYLTEIVSMLAIFISVINNGEEDLLKRYSIAKTLLIASIVYFAFTVLIYLAFDYMTPSMLKVIVP
ncbi:MAG: hypothetical protein QMD12_03125 [Candidatus Aenigmarchaeota archaeon]|nr:hypothetical protein [Candidatus Aenigmarchaeota archaeon]